MVTATQMRVLPILGKILQARSSGMRGIWLEGGTAASKTYSTMQFLKLIAEAENESHPLSGAGEHRRALHLTVMSETMPHLKGGAILDFRNIMADDWDERSWHDTDKIYRWQTTGSWIQFLSADAYSKVKGPRRDILFVNELNHIEREIFRQADWRSDFTLADWNPESDFWWHEEELDENRQLVDRTRAYVHTTYLDALDVMGEGKRDELEAMETKDPNFWRVYGLGLPGKIEGLVYPGFEQVSELPSGDYFYGLDYGFASDPTVLVKNIIIGDNLYSQQMFYNYNHLTNEDIAREMKLCRVGGNEPIWADRDELKSAEELSRLGFNVKPVDKAFYGREFRTKKVNEYYQHWTSDSLECIKEQRNFRFIKRIVQGVEQLTDDTTHRWSHGMTAREFGVVSFRANKVRPRVKHSMRL